MKNSLWNRVLHNPITPIACLILGAAVNGFMAMRADMDWACFFELALAVLGLVSGLLCCQNRKVRYVAIALLAIMILDAGIGSDRVVSAPKASAKATSLQTVETDNTSGNPGNSVYQPTSGYNTNFYDPVYPAGGTAGSGGTYHLDGGYRAGGTYHLDGGYRRGGTYHLDGGYRAGGTYHLDGAGDTGGTGDTGTRPKPESRDCTFCSGTGKCHICHGVGYSACNGPACSGGKCTSCRGTGMYDHGSYRSPCITCSGDGRCNICNGLAKVKCNSCSGSGDCSQCKGTGKKP